MRLIICIPFLLIMSCCTVSAQRDSMLMQTSKLVHQSQYFDYEGSPYYFKDWVQGNVLRTDATYMKDVRLNYNGFTHEIEVQSGDEIYALDKRWYLRADISRDENPALETGLPARLTFQLGLHRALADRYGAILFHGTHLTLIRDFNVGKQRKEYSEFGVNNYVATFRDQSIVYLKRDNELIPLKLHKKRIAEAFEHQDRILDFIDREDLDVKRDTDLIRLVAYADQL